MGGSQSKEQSLEEQLRKQLSSHGVLVPPSMLEPVPLSSAISLFSQQQEKPLASWDVMITRSPGKRLLQDYLKPGIWLAGSSATEHSTVLAAFDFHKHRVPIVPSEDDAPLNIAAGGNGMLCLSHSLNPNTHLNLLAPTHGVPSVSLIQSLPSFTQLSANLNADGHGWMGGSLETTIHRPPSWLGIRKFMVGSGAEFQLFMDPPAAPPSSGVSKAEKADSGNHGIHVPITTLFGLAGIDVHGTLLAVAAEIPVSNLPEPQLLLRSFQNNLRALVHTNLNLDDQPPLWFTAQAHPARGDFSVQVCQTLTFDRYVWNLMEDRAPHIRNALTWTVEMSKITPSRNPHNRLHPGTTATTTSTVLDDEDSLSTISNDGGTAIGNNNSHNTIPTRLTAGMAWQFNRNVAVKAVTTPAEGNIRGAIIFQRWKQPQLVCSLIGEYQMWNQKGRFIGVGLELGNLSSNASALPSWHQHSDPDGKTTEDRVWDAAFHASPSANAPETKVILPK